MTYGQKLIAEAIEAHFGERVEVYDEDVDDTSNHDAWEAFDALSTPPKVGSEELDAQYQARYEDDIRSALQPSDSPALEAGVAHRIEHDGFEGTVQGTYVTREGKRGVVLQQIGTKVVHVYGEKWLAALSIPAKEDGK